MINNDKLNKAMKNDPWFDPNNTHLDLSSCPSFNITSEADASFYDDKFSQRDMTAGFTSSGLKQFLQDPLDTSTISELARVTGDPELIDAWQDRRAEAIARAFMKLHPDYYPTQNNFLALKETLCESVDVSYDTTPQELAQMGVWTVENLEAAFEQLKADGQIEVAPGTTRQLSPSELQRIAVLVNIGQIQAACEQYVALSLDKPANYLQTLSQQQEFEMASDPKLKPLFKAAAFFVFQHSTLDYRPSEKAEAYLDSYIGNRMPTVALYQTAWQQFKESTKHSYLFGSPAIQVDEEIDFENLTDIEIADLKRRTLKEYFKQNRNQ